MNVLVITNWFGDMVVGLTYGEGSYGLKERYFFLVNRSLFNFERKLLEKHKRPSVQCR